MTINDQTATDLERISEVESNCPPWCRGQHAQAYREGCSFESAAEHLSYDRGAFLPRLTHPYSNAHEREGGGRWSVQLRQHTQLYGPEQRVGLAMPIVELEVGSRAGTTESRSLALALTTGEARSLAAVLLHVVAQEELGDHR